MTRLDYALVANSSSTFLEGIPMSTHPLRLAVGSHQAGSGKGCAMNVISWESGDSTITDLPDCADPFLARVVQGVNDRLTQAHRIINRFLQLTGITPDPVDPAVTADAVRKMTVNA